MEPIPDFPGSWNNQESGGALSGISSAVGLLTGNPLIGLAGNILGGLFGKSSAKSQNEAQIAQAREQMAFQERMSSTAHQREVTDLRLAGLNPILSATRGASSPGGAQAQIVNEGGQGLTSALAVNNAVAQTALLEAQARNLDAQTATERSRPDVLNSQINLQSAQTALADAGVTSQRILNIGQELDNDIKEWQLLQQPEQLGKIRVELDSMAANLHALENAGEISKSAYGKALAWVNATSKALQGSMDVANSAVSTARQVHGMRPETVTRSERTIMGKGYRESSGSMTRSR